MARAPFLRQLVGFGVSGVLAFLVDAGVYFLGLPVLGAFWAKQVSFVVATVASFFLNRRLTFGLDKTHPSKVVLFVLFYLAMMWVNPWINWELLKVTSNKLAALVVATVVTSLVNFTYMRTVVFSHKEKST